MALVNFSWVIPGKLAGSGLPGGRVGAVREFLEPDIRELESNGVRVLVSLQRVPELFGTVCAENGIEWIHYPIEDFGVPHDLEAYSGLIDALVERIEHDKPVCIHCRAGVGRTGMALACTVARLYGVSGQQAIRTVQRQRTAIDTPAQTSFVQAFCCAHPGSSRGDR